VLERTGKNLRAVDLLVASGGVFRAAGLKRAASRAGRRTGSGTDGWQCPESRRSWWTTTRYWRRRTDALHGATKSRSGCPATDPQRAARGAITWAGVSIE